MEAILDELDDGVVVLNPEHAILYANAIAREMLGTPGGELIGRPFPFPIPQDKSDVELPSKDMLLELRASEITWHALPAHLIIIRDVTQRRRQEALYTWFVEQTGTPLVPPAQDDAGGADPPRRGEAAPLLGYEDLLQREQRARADAENQRMLLQGVLDQAPVMMSILGGPELIYQYVNDRYCKLLGRPESAFLGKTIQEALPEISGMGLYELLAQVYRSGQSVRAVERLYRVDLDGDGVPEDMYLTTSYHPIRASDGQVIGILVHVLDATEHVRARQALEQKSKEVAQLNRELEQRVAERTAQLQAANAELESFAYSVSHDLRAPLRRIDGFSVALLEDCGDRLDESGQRYLSRIRVASQHMGQLIDDLLELSRISRLDVQARAVDLSALARRILSTFHEHSPERQVTIEIAPDMTAWGDSKFLSIALENLLDNAWKFTARTEGATIEVGRMEQKGEQVFFIRDNGAGFDPTYSMKLFETFNRLHSPVDFPGTGIGLATVKRVIERHGGQIWAEGAVDKGAVFYFTLPTPETVSQDDQDDQSSGGA